MKKINTKFTYSYKVLVGKISGESVAILRETKKIVGEVLYDFKFTDLSSLEEIYHIKTITSTEAETISLMTQIPIVNVNEVGLILIGSSWVGSTVLMGAIPYLP